MEDDWYGNAFHLVTHSLTTGSLAAGIFLSSLYSDRSFYRSYSVCRYKDAISPAASNAVSWIAASFVAGEVKVSFVCLLGVFPLIYKATRPRPE